jgi:hypothetical protein
MTINFIAHSLTAISAIFAPLVTTEFIIPTILHPYKLGGIPFKTPGIFKYTSIYLLCIVLIVGTFATISGMMTTARECKKVEFWSAAVSAKWSMLFALIGLSVVFFLPLIKAPLLALLAPVPFSNLISNGIVMSAFVVFGHFLGDNYLLRTVCGSGV